jgi:hypothetical protein
MAQDYFAILGLTPGRYASQRIANCFEAERTRLLAQLGDPTRHAELCAQLDELYVAYNTLRDPARQNRYRRECDNPPDRVTTLRRLIAASIEGGLLRHSRRQAIIERGAALGLSEFQSQLLIAQVQFGDDEIEPLPRPAAGRIRYEAPRLWARVAAVGVLALAMFLGMVRWVST